MAHLEISESEAKVKVEVKVGVKVKVSSRWRTLKSDLFSEDDFLSFYGKKMVAFLIKMFEWCRRMDGSFDKNAEPWLHL